MPTALTYHQTKRIKHERQSASERGYGWKWRNANRTGAADEFLRGGSRMPKPFDLQKALAGKPVLWPGYEVKKVLYVPERGDKPRVLVITSDGLFAWFKDDGKSDYDECLTMADPPKRRVEGWINVYKSDVSVYRLGCHLYESQPEAYDAAINHCDVIAQAFVTFYVEDEA
jgi:hypothetical protein